ncbi:MAG: hypothetical protein DRP87_17425 [Spirochaetes bacterium]|nr:MAG: hypothetical protein DRP87_17425 [Spirochaetota bacterium]
MAENKYEYIINTSRDFITLINRNYVYTIEKFKFGVYLRYMHVSYYPYSEDDTISQSSIATERKIAMCYGFR